jgi:hypothetical protein
MTRSTALREPVGSGRGPWHRSPLAGQERAGVARATRCSIHPFPCRWVAGMSSKDPGDSTIATGAPAADAAMGEGRRRLQRQLARAQRSCSSQG